MAFYTGSGVGERMFTHLFFTSENFLYSLKMKLFLFFSALCKYVLVICSGLGFLPSATPLVSELLPCNKIKIWNEQMNATIFWFLRLCFALPAQPSHPKHKADFSAFFPYFLYGWYFSGCQFHIISKSAHLVLHFLLKDNCHLLYIAEAEQAQHIATCHS